MGRKSQEAKTSSVEKGRLGLAWPMRVDRRLGCTVEVEYGEDQTGRRVRVESLHQKENGGAIREKGSGRCLWEGNDKLGTCKSSDVGN